MLDEPVHTNEVLTETGLWHDLPKDNSRRHYWVATSPNVPYIPKAILGPRIVRARKDGRYGLEDRVQYPQYYATEFEYISCIRRRPSDKAHSLQLMWWTPTLADFSLLEGSAFDMDLGMLSKRMLILFRSHRDRYVQCSRQIQAAKGPSSMCNLLENNICNCYARVAGTAQPFKTMLLSVAEFQRACLDLEAYLDFHMKFLPGLKGGVKPAELDPDRIGAFTESTKVAHDLFMMGIPVWLLRPSSHVTDDATHIINVVNETQPTGIELGDWEDEFGNVKPFAEVYHGPPGTAMLRATQRLAGMYADMRFVSLIGMGGQNTPSPEGTSTSHINSLSGPSHNPNRSGFPHATKRSRPSHAMSQFALPREPTILESNKPCMPPPVPVWADALGRVDHSPSRLYPRREGGNIGYRFPDPRFLGATTNMASYVVSWLGSRAYHLWHISNNGAPPPTINTQQWKTFLHSVKMLLLKTEHGPGLSSEPQAGPSSLSSLKRPYTTTDDGPNKKQKRKGKARVKKSNSYLDEMSHPLAENAPDRVFWLDKTIMLGGGAEEIEAQLRPEITAQILWELFELNFRFEVLNLDRALSGMWTPTGDLTLEQAQELRDSQVRGVFARDGEALGSYVLLDIPECNAGLAAENWMDRAPHIFALARLMSAWKDCPTPIRYSSEFMSEFTVGKLEKEVADFYCQTFFNVFHRAPIIPCRLPPPAA